MGVKHRWIMPTGAQQVFAATAFKWDRDSDVRMGAVLQDASSLSANAREPSLSWHLQGYCATLAAGGDLDFANALNRETDCCKSGGRLQVTKGLR